MTDERLPLTISVRLQNQSHTGPSLTISLHQTTKQNFTKVTSQVDVSQLLQGQSQGQGQVE